MTFADTSFKRVSLKVGIAMLVFFGAYNFLLTPVALIKQTFPPSTVLGEVILEIGYGLAYLLSFIIPAIVFRKIIPKEEREPLGIKKAPVKEIPLIILLSVAIVFACARINALMVSSFDFYDKLQELLAPSGPMLPYQILLQVFTVAIVPAICEEMLFRSTILSSLLPYGKSFAIISSAVLFGLMHKNPLQFFYATAAGIVLGYVYVKTKSFWCVFLIHFTNNLLSVIQSAALSDPDYIMGARFATLLEAAIVILGFASAIFLIIIGSKKKSVYDTGSFGKILDSHDGYIEKPISFSPFKVFFKTPTVLIFTIICVLEAISIVLLYSIQY